TGRGIVRADEPVVPPGYRVTRVRVAPAVGAHAPRAGVLRPGPGPAIVGWSGRRYPDRRGRLPRAAETKGPGRGRVTGATNEPGSGPIPHWLVVDRIGRVSGPPGPVQHVFPVPLSVVAAPARGGLAGGVPVAEAGAPKAPPDPGRAGRLVA